MPLLAVPKKWDRTTDVIVVGAGNAGSPAAITAAEKGAKVLLLEAGAGHASSLAKVTGGHNFAGTDFQKGKGIDDSPQKMLDNVLEKTEGSPDLWRVFAYKQLEAYEWIKGLVGEPVAVMYAPPHNEMRLHRFKGMGPAWLKALRKELDEKGIEILFKQRVHRLILDPQTGSVIGIRSLHGTEAMNFRARKAVILATGGFLNNKELVKEFGPFAAGCIPAVPKTHRGDGLIMGLDVGAATANLSTAAAPSISICTTTKLTTQMWAQGPIMVNRDCHRWASEAGPPYNVTFKNLLEQHPDGLHFIIYDNKIRAAGAPDNYVRLKEFKADSIEGLAEAVSLDPRALMDTVHQYNSNIDQFGYDTVYGRRHWGGLAGKQPVPKIDSPPFYALKCQVSLTSAKGGLKINTKSQVIDLYGKPIPRLYAAGEITGGFFCKPNVYIPGTFTVLGIVFGRIAGENASLESPA